MESKANTDTDVVTPGVVYDRILAAFQPHPNRPSDPIDVMVAGATRITVQVDLSGAPTFHRVVLQSDLDLGHVDTGANWQVTHTDYDGDDQEQSLPNLGAAIAHAYNRARA